MQGMGVTIVANLGGIGPVDRGAVPDDHRA